jgi:DnaJ-class molecular chaperone
MKKLTYKDIKDSLRLLGLGDAPSLNDIKKAYYACAKKYHPDMCKGKGKKKCEEEFKKITHAHKILLFYCKKYGQLSDPERVKENIMGKEYYNHMKRFYDGWWGNLDL